MRAGRRDRRITIQRKTVTLSNTGEPTEVWSDLATVWASVAPLTGTERLTGENLAAKEQVQFRILWSAALAGINPQDRIKYPSSTDSPSDLQLYDIVQASEIGRQDIIQILAYRYVNS